MARFVSILFIALLVHPAVCIAEDELKGLISDYAHYTQVIRPSLTPQQTSAYDATWATAIAGGIDGAEATSEYLITAKSIVGRLLVAQGAYVRAIDYLDAVVEDAAADPGTRLSAAFELCSALAMLGSEADVVLDSISTYVQLMIEFDEMGIEYPEAHRLNGLRADAMRANLITRSMKGWLESDAFKTVPEETMRQLRAVHLDAAAMYQQRFVEFLLTQGDQHSLMASDMSQLLAHAVAVARLNDMAATAYGTVAVNRAAAAHNRTFAILNHLRNQMPETFSHEAAVHLLNSYFHLLPSNGLASYVALAEDVVGNLRTGHGVINFLRQQALEFSNEPTRRSAAKDIFDLIIATEVKWFPNEYESHVNYQWARIGAAKNALRMNNPTEAELHLNAIASVALAGNYFPMEYARLADLTGVSSQN